MSKLVTTPISKVKSGIKGATTSPANFIISLGIGFGAGILADLILEAIWWHGGATALQPVLGNEFPYFGIFPNRTTSMAWDDFFLLLITIAMLFTKKFVLTLGFFIGWYTASYYGLYDAFGLPKT